MTTVTTTTTDIDYDAVKARQRDMWASGDYATIGTTLQIVGETLCEAVDIAAGSRVLDVAAGNGNASLAAARRGAVVTATDYVDELLARTARRAEAENLAIETRTADAEALDLPDGSFDSVLSVFGVMFAPHQEQAAAELVRVCRPGGRIGVANWTPTGFVGQMLKTVTRYAPPPAGVRSPLEWGTEARLTELLGDGVSAITATTRQFVFRYRSPQDFVDTFRATYGPTVKAFGGLDDDGRAELERELLALAESHNTTTSSLRVPSDYLEVVATRA